MHQSTNTLINQSTNTRIHQIKKKHYLELSNKQKTMLKIILFALTMMTQTNTDTKLIYIGDPMCSWCYGIAAELEKTKAQLDGSIEFEIIMGGLRPYNTQTMPELKDFLTEHWEQVHQASGQEFKYGILDEAGITYDTEPPSRATVIVRDLAPEKAFAFFHAIQKDFYFENKNMHLVESYYDALDKIEVDKAEFKRLFESDEMKQKVRRDFERAAEYGINSFPSILLKTGEQYHLISSGYTTSDNIIQKVKSLTN